MCTFFSLAYSRIPAPQLMFGHQDYISHKYHIKMPLVQITSASQDHSCQNLMCRVFVISQWNSGFTSHVCIEGLRIKKQIPLCRSSCNSVSSYRGGEPSEIQRLDPFPSELSCWQRRKQDEIRRRKKEDSELSLKSRDPHLAGGEKPSKHNKATSPEKYHFPPKKLRINKLLFPQIQVCFHKRL